MHEEDLYEFSGQVNTVLLSAKDLLGLNLLRYKHLVDNSERGFECAYAQISRRHFLENQEKELSTLQDVADLIQSLITGIKEYETEDNL